MKLKWYLMLLGFTFFTGATFHLAKYAVAYFSAPSAAAWRFGLAAVTMILILTMREGFKSATIRQNGGAYLLLGIVGVFGFNALFFIGMQMTSAINGSLIMATNPLVTTILAALLLHNRITVRQGIGIGFSLAGVVLVITQGSWDVIRTLSFSTGDLLIMLGNICWALYGVLGRRWVKNSSSLATTTYTMIMGAVCLVVASLIGPANPVSVTDVPMLAWGAIGFMAFFTTVLGYLWWNQAMAELGAARTAVYFNLVPVVTMVISVVMGSAVTWLQVLGAGLVIAGVLIASGVLTERKLVTGGTGGRVDAPVKAGS
ncbi:DMT family transporter [Brevibacillus dissolubilis]|uniref:DMT family transporter n=1 Tax=Brevibacillus dissolubilis TaxID=1844116 RepID=UPI001116D082|nr:DMT family transporter [Brevibacillus dissolubilis]